MSDWQETPGHWQASDGKWYPPETHPDYQPPPMPRPPEPAAPQPTPPQPTPISAQSLPAQPIGAPPMGPPPAGPVADENPWWRRSGVIIGGLVAIVALVAVAVFAAGGDDPETVSSNESTTGDSESSVEPLGDPDPTPTPVSDTSTAPEPTTPAPTPTATAAAPAGEPGQDGDEAAESSGTADVSPSPDVAAASSGTACTYLGVDSFDDMQVLLDFVSETTQPTDLNITYGLYDSDGTRFTTSTKLIESAAPGEPFRLQADTLEDLPASLATDSGITCEILEFEEFDFGSDPARPAPLDSCTVLGVDSFGDIQVEIAVTNQSADASDLFVTYALRADGVRFDESFASLDIVGAGEQVTQEDDSLTDIPEWAGDAELTCELLEIDSFG